MIMKESIFKAYDVRGIYPTEINEAAAYKVGRAFVKFTFAKTVVVGHDMRPSSLPLKEKLIAGITAEGADVIDIGLCTTPMLNFAVTNYQYDGGIMISASHNPAEYNAFKLVRPYSQQVGADSGMAKIKELSFGIEEEESGAVAATLTKDVLSDYLAHLLKYADGIEGIKVVVDYGNGVGAVSGSPAFARLDIDLVEINKEPDGSFPNHPANPHDVVNFKQLQKKVLAEKADLGIFFDGDADRSILVDEAGRIVPVDLETVLLAKEELAGSPDGKVYYDLRFSKSVPDQITEMGGKPVMLKVGNPVYKKALKEEGGILGAEFSGHIMYPENFFMDDGLFAAIKVMKFLSKSGKKLSNLIDEINKYCDSDEESFEAKNPDTVYDRIYMAFPEGKRVELDGAYVDLTDGFVSVRQSQSEPQLFRIRVEATTKEGVNERLEKVRGILRA